MPDSDQFTIGTRCPACGTLSAAEARLGALILDGWEEAVGNPKCPTCGEPMEHTGRGWQPRVAWVEGE